MNTETNRALDQAKAQMESIQSMVAALNCDYDLLEELRNQRADWFEENPSSFAHINDPRNGGRWHLACPDEAEELAELEEAAGDCEGQDQARQRIKEDALSVEVRSGWQSIGETVEPEEFCILLCTGGPAVRIIGKLNQHREPGSARIQYQDWGTPWTELLDGVDHEALLAYCAVFYFGE